VDSPVDDEWNAIAVQTNINVLGTRWLFRTKTDGRRKTRLLVQGFDREHGVDYYKTYASIVEPMSVKVVSALNALMNWHIEQNGRHHRVPELSARSTRVVETPERYKIPGKV
jgi:hypothetical protein